MALQRIRFGGSGAPATWTTLSINPIEIDLQDSCDQDVIETLDGESVIHQAAYDARPRSLTWRGIGLSNTVFQSQLATMENYLHKTFWVAYRDIDYRIHDTTTWNKVRCQDIIITMQSGGRLKYDSVVMLLLPAKT